MTARPPISYEDYVRFTRERLGRSPYGRLMGWKVEEMEPDRAVFTLPFDPKFMGQSGAHHGGAVASLIDSTASCAAISVLGLVTSERNFTVSLFANFLAAAAPESPIRAEARARKRGKSIVIVDVDVEDSEGRLIATGTVTYRLGSKKKPEPALTEHPPTQD